MAINFGGMFGIGGVIDPGFQAITFADVEFYSPNLNKDMTELARLKFTNPVKITSVTEDGVVFSDGTKIVDYHESDCCEHVYADWKQLEDQEILDEELTEVVIYGKPGIGIVLNKSLVPCYNSQNGYYSSRLTILVGQKDEPLGALEVSKFVKDQIS